MDTRSCYLRNSPKKGSYSELERVVPLIMSEMPKRALRESQYGFLRIPLNENIYSSQFKNILDGNAAVLAVDEVLSVLGYTSDKRTAKTQSLVHKGN